MTLADCPVESAQESGERTLPNESRKLSFADVSQTASACLTLFSTVSLRERPPQQQGLAGDEPSGHTERSETSAHADEFHSTRPAWDTSPAIAESVPAAVSIQQAVGGRRSSSNADDRRIFRTTQACSGEQSSRSLENSSHRATKAWQCRRAVQFLLDIELFRQLIRTENRHRLKVGINDPDQQHTTLQIQIDLFADRLVRVRR